MNDQNKTITPTELANILDISRAAVSKMMKKKEIKSAKLGSGYVIKWADLPKDIQARVKEAQEKGIEKAHKKIKEQGKTSDKDLGFEKELWSAADKLRGNIDASDYKSIVLGLIFLKYISDSFTKRKEQLGEWMSDSTNHEYYIKDEKSRNIVIEDSDQYKGAGMFFVPVKARWVYLQEQATQTNISQIIDQAMEEIEKANPKELKGVLPKVYTRIALESHVIGELVNLFSKVNFDHDFDKEKDVLGRVYEYFLGQFASAEGKRGGEFYTPRSLVRLLVEVLEPFENARVLDPSCGSGGMFVQSAEFLRMHKEDPNRISFSGQESNPNTWKLCKMNLALRGITGQIEQGNSYYDDKFPDGRYDFVLANPPFNADWDPGRLSDNDSRLKYGTPPKTNANFMWIQHFIHHLAPNGIAGFVMANGALAVSGREGEIRKKIVEDDLADIIIACPAKLFYNVALPVSLWFLTKNKKNGRFRNRTGETLFIDARELYEQISRKQVIFNAEHIQKISGKIQAWRLPARNTQAGGEKGASKYEDVLGFCKTVKKEELEKANYVLTPGRYVGLAEEEDDLPASRPNTFYVYVIKCDDSSLYIGQTNDLRQRWQEHANGQAAEWTKKHKPLYIAHHEIYSTREKAVKRERNLKTGFGRKWLKREIEAGRARQAGGVPFEEKMQKLSAELKDAFQKGDKLEKTIIDNLKKFDV